MLYESNNAWLNGIKASGFYAGDGGFLSLDKTDNFIEILNSVFEEFNVDKTGAFAYINSRNIFKLKSSVINNSVAKIKGGLLYVVTNNSVFIEECEFRDISSGE